MIAYKIVNKETGETYRRIADSYFRGWSCSKGDYITFVKEADGGVYQDTYRAEQYRVEITKTEVIFE